MLNYVLMREDSSKKVSLKWKKLYSKAVIPKKQTRGAAAFDLVAAFEEESIVLRKGEVYAIPTGLAVEVPEGYELQLRARSGLAFKHGLTLVNGVGTIDSDYRGEIKVLVSLLAADELKVECGDRIAQALVSELVETEHVEVQELSETERGAGGFGSTGVSAQQ